MFTQPFIQTHIKENIKAPRHWPLCVGIHRDRWIPRTKGQLRGKCFHLMTSSCSMLVLHMFSESFPMGSLVVYWMSYISVNWGLVTPIGVSYLSYHRFKLWLVANLNQDFTRTDVALLCWHVGAKMIWSPIRRCQFRLTFLNQNDCMLLWISLKVQLTINKPCFM